MHVGGQDGWSQSRAEGSQGADGSEKHPGSQNAVAGKELRASRLLFPSEDEGNESGRLWGLVQGHLPGEAGGGRVGTRA